MLAKNDGRGVQDYKVVVGIEVFPHMDMKAVITEKGWLDQDVRAAGAEQTAQQRVALVGRRGRQGIVLEALLLGSVPRGKERRLAGVIQSAGNHFFPLSHIGVPPVLIG